MRDATYFTKPIHEWQKRYEALRASFVDRLPAAAVAERFGYSAGYVHLLRHQFTTGKIDFSGPFRKAPLPDTGSLQIPAGRSVSGERKNSRQARSLSCFPKMVSRSRFVRWSGSWRKRDSPSFPVVAV